MTHRFDTESPKRDYGVVYYIQEAIKPYLYMNDLIQKKGIELRFYTDSTCGTVEIVFYRSGHKKIHYEESYFMPDSKYSENLSDFEQEVFDQIVTGFAHQEICGTSKELFISILWNLIKKSGVLDSLGE